MARRHNLGPVHAGPVNSDFSQALLRRTVQKTRPCASWIFSAFLFILPALFEQVRSTDKIKKSRTFVRDLQILRFCGERGIRTPGTVIPYVSLANWWFKPLTHLSFHAVTNRRFRFDKSIIILSIYKISRGEFLIK